MLRYVFLCLLFVFPAVSAAGAEGLNIGVYGGAANVLLEEYNNSIDEANDYNSELGITGGLNKLELAFIPEITACYNFKIPPFFAGVYIKNFMAALMDNSGLAEWESGGRAQEINADLSAFYTGAGARLSLGKGGGDSFVGFFGVDAGIYHYYNNYIYEALYKENGDVLYEIKKTWKTAVPGICLEAGVNWWFAGKTGLSLKAGYRAAGGNVMVDIENIRGWTGESQAEDYVDYSGFFCQAGIGLRFGRIKRRDKAKEAEIKVTEYPGIGGWLIKEAKSLFEEGLYRMARAKILEAEKTAPDDEKIRKLKQKIESMLSYENEKQRIKELIKEAEELRLDEEYGKAAGRYLEVLEIDPSNKIAAHYTKKFRKKAKVYYEGASEFYEKKDFKSALEKINLAVDYGGGRDAINLKNKIKNTIENRKKADRFYNLGVDSYKKRDYAGAIDYWNETLKLNPDDTDAKANIRKAEEKIRETEEKEKEEIKKALKEAKSLFELGEINRAKGKCGYIMRLDPGNKECAELLEKIEAIDSNKEVEVIKKR